MKDVGCVVVGGGAAQDDDGSVLSAATLARSGLAFLLDI